jgi:Co/Zn/Cd efflux system component
MKHLNEAVRHADLQKKVDRAKLIIFVLMFLFMTLPFVAAWLSGALRF